MKSGCTLSAVALAACLALGACKDPAPSPPASPPAAEPPAPATPATEPPAPAAEPPATPTPVPSAPTSAATPPATPPAPSAQEPGWTQGRMTVTRSGAPATLREVRSGRNEGFDRIVFQFDGDTLPGYQLEFLDALPIRCGSGDPTELAGQARLQVRLQPAQAHAEGKSTLPSLERTETLPVLVALKQTCDFEGEVTWALGLKQPRPYRVLELNAPARIVVDVRH